MTDTASAGPLARLAELAPVSTIVTAFTTVVVGFASTIPIVTDAARMVGASPEQTASWVAALCFGMGITTFFLCLVYRMPAITAWSTPGAVLLATSAHGGAITYPQALGAFVVAALLMCLTAAFKPLARLIERIPAPIAAAMLAGVLVRYCLNVPGAAKALPVLVLPLCVLFLALRFWKPVIAVPITVAAAFAGSAAAGSMAPLGSSFGLTWLTWTTPEFNLPIIISLGLPLYLVTMASQNLPGFAVLRLAGYQPPVQGALWTTGIATTLLAPFGAHAITMAAITAALCAGQDCHPDPAQRWRVGGPYVVIYCALGLFAGAFVALLAILPQPVFVTIAGLALLSPLIGAFQGMTRDPQDIDAAAIGFLVTAANVTIAGIGSAFWGLAAGLAVHGAKALISRRAARA